MWRFRETHWTGAPGFDPDRDSSVSRLSNITWIRELSSIGSPCQLPDDDRLIPHPSLDNLQHLEGYHFQIQSSAQTTLPSSEHQCHQWPIWNFHVDDSQAPDLSTRHQVQNGSLISHQSPQDAHPLLFQWVPYWERTMSFNQQLIQNPWGLPLTTLSPFSHAPE